MASELNYIVATAGHIDHGKSTLIEALTGTNPDRLPEEKSRGMTIDLGFAHLDLTDPEFPDKSYNIGFIDVPGHADFIKNMVAGAGAVDVAMFVVAADDGWMPQSEEHLQILSYLNVRNAVVALTKADTVDDIEFSAEIVADALKGTTFEEAQIVPVCSLIGDGIEELRSALASTIRKTPTPADIGKPRLSVDRVFSPKGVGTVVTGTMTGGTFEQSQKVIIQPQGSEATLRSIQSYNSNVSKSSPGIRTALNLPDIGIRKGKSRDGIRRGDTITVTKTGNSSRRVHVIIERSSRETKAGNLHHSQRIRFHHCSSNIAGKLLFFENRDLNSGDKAIAEIRLDSPGFTLAGDRFVLRDWSKRFTLGGGTVLDPTPPRRSYRTEEQKRFLETRASSDPCPKLYLQSLLSRDLSLPATELLTQSCFSADEIAKATKQVDLTCIGDWILDQNWWNEITALAATRIETIHNKHPDLPGLDVNMLRSFVKKRLPDLKLFEALVDQLVSNGFVRTGTVIRKVDHIPKLPAELQSSSDRIRKILNSAPLEPPNPKELAKTEAESTALKFLLQTGEAVQLDEKAILLKIHFDNAVKTVKAHIAANGPSTAADIRKSLGTTRRILIPFLEKLDKEGITKREGDLRVLS